MIYVIRNLRTYDSKKGLKKEKLKSRHKLIDSLVCEDCTLWKKAGEKSDEIFVAKVSRGLAERFTKQRKSIANDKDLVDLSDYIFDYLEGHNWLFDL